MKYSVGMLRAIIHNSGISDCGIFFRVFDERDFRKLWEFLKDTNSHNI